jgi:hypothetical protein
MKSLPVYCTQDFTLIKGFQANQTVDILIRLYTDKVSCSYTYRRTAALPGNRKDRRP